MAADYRSLAFSAIDDCKEELRDVSNEIWQHPELCFEERHAHKVLTDYLEKKGFSVQRGYCGLETAFRADASNGDGLHVCVICEYDALPEIGHACGHNLIAEAGVAAGCGLKAALDGGGLVGTVTIMGTPAEEGGGGKVLLIERGAFEGIDMAMMVHPAPHNAVDCDYLAVSRVVVTYHGKAAHAAAFPWEGTNALDAVVMAYSSISAARQQFKPTWRVHGIIKEGGVQPNIIPARASLYYYIRAPTRLELTVLKAKLTSCFDAAAVATGCEVSIATEGQDYENVLSNPLLGDLFVKSLESQGVKDVLTHSPAGSTDMGNVTHVVPGIHPKYAIGRGQANHTPSFTEVSNTPEAHVSTLVAAKAMVDTGLAVMTNGDLYERVKQSFLENKDIQ